MNLLTKLHFVCLCIVVTPQFAYSNPYYRFEDDEGTVHFSDERPETDYPVQEMSFHESFRTAIRRTSKAELKRMITNLSAEYKVEPSLIEAIVKAESEYDPMAVSKKGARGLMQLMPATARSLGVNNVHDPEENMRGGVKYLQKLLSQFHDNIDCVIAAYNAGENAITRYNGIPPFTETVDYVKKVRKYYENFKQLATESASINVPIAPPSSL